MFDVVVVVAEVEGGLFDVVATVGGPNTAETILCPSELPIPYPIPSRIILPQVGAGAGAGAGAMGNDRVCGRDVWIGVDERDEDREEGEVDRGILCFLTCSRLLDLDYRRSMFDLFFRYMMLQVSTSKPPFAYTP